MNYLRLMRAVIAVLFVLLPGVAGLMKVMGQGSVPEGALPGFFSVSENTFVHFSQGNLQYIGSAGNGDENNSGAYWKFAENQWDYFGENGQGSDLKTVDRDLFGWGTSGWNNGNVYYQPWSTDYVDDYNQGYGYGPTDGTNYTYNLTDVCANADWGYNAIINGGNQENSGWRTLTSNEWEYLFNTRNTPSGIRYAMANVNGVNGVILLPDEWSVSYYSLSNTNMGNTSFGTNTISASQWVTLEQHGAVFLPAACYRLGSSIHFFGYGFYWSTSYYSNGSATGVFFGYGDLYTDIGNYRYYGLSVRLVRPAQNYSYSINAAPNPAEGGTVSGAGTYPASAECTLTAAASVGYTFINWTENGEVVSTEATYSFTVTGDRELVANFIEKADNEGLIYDPFEEYTVGNKIAAEAIAAGHGWWTTWSNAPGSGEDGVVADYGGAQCGHLTYGNDLVLLLGDEENGNYDLEFDILVPEGKNGYFNILHHFAGSNSTWAMQCYLHLTNNGTYSTSAPGHGTVHAGSNATADVPCVYNEWMHFRLNVDTDTDVARYYYTAPGQEEMLICYWQWSLDSFGESTVGRALSAMDFIPSENSATSEYYLDNFSFKRIGGASASAFNITPNTVAETLGEDVVSSVNITLNNEGNAIGEWVGWVDFGQGGDGTQSAELAYHNGESGSNIGSTTEFTREMAIRLPITTYGVTATGMKITSVDYYINSSYKSADDHYTFRIYGQGVNNQPGVLLAEQTIVSSELDKWITATFDEAVYLTGQTIWVTVGLQQSADEYPMSMDGGDYDKESDGNWLKTNGGLFDHCYTEGGISGAWMITVHCEGELVPAAWASINKSDGSLSGGQSDVITLTLNPTGLAHGTYNANLIINTNDENMSHVEIPVTLYYGLDYTVNATPYPAEGGTVSGAGTYPASGECTLTATASAGYIFVNWTENGEVVSTDPTYLFTVKGDRELVANFATMGNGNIGATWYDWQSNSGPITRTVVWPDGKVNFAFTQALTYNFVDRGTGIGTYANGEWIPSMGRVEAQRTGFGSIARYGANGLVVASHTAMNCGVYLISDRDNIVSNSLSPVSVLDNTYSPGWPNVMTSGVNRDIIHVIANATATVVPGMESVTDPILYFRSMDGGQTWDKENVILPYMTSDYCLSWSSNSCYWMETTEDNCLALVVNDPWSDGMVIYSYDDGETWQRKVFYKHPNPFGSFEEPFYFPKWTSCQWDSQHRLHVLYEYFSTSGEAGSGSLYPNIGGVAYWNETLPYNLNGTTTSEIPGNLTPGQPFVMDNDYLANDIHNSWWGRESPSHEMWPEYIGYLPPLSNEGIPETPYYGMEYNLYSSDARNKHGQYNQGVCAFPVLCKVPGTDEMVAVWSALDENHTDASGNYYYKIFASYSGDGGTTWSPMVHLTRNPEFDYSEFVYNQAVVVGRKLIIATQTDLETGTYVQSDENIGDNNYYRGFVFDIDELFDTTPPQEYTITVSADPADLGVVSGGGSYHYGSYCTLTATPNVGIAFTHWTKDGETVSEEPIYRFKVTGDVSYVAHFTDQAFTIAAIANPAEGGAIMGAGTIAEGQTCTLSATANTGYVFSGWTLEDGELISSTPTFSFTVTENASYVANFTALAVCQITVTANPSQGGSVSGGGSFYEGDECTLTAIAYEGYQFAYWSTEAVDIVSTNPTFSFTIAESASYVANFIGIEGFLGYTYYDWQSNSGPITRTVVWPDGKVNFAFTQALEEGYWDRGTGIGTYDAVNNEWIASEGRVENEKTGFGSIARYGENGIVVAAHTAYDCRIYLISDKENIPYNSLEATSILDNTYEPCWPNVMTSGANRDIIHVVARGGSNGIMYYFRSIDGGWTWDKQNVILPYMGSEYGTYWESNSCYWMETTEDNCLALVVNNPWSDGMVIYSYDDGETWQRKVFYKHPDPFGSFEEPFYFPKWTSCQWDNQHHLHVLYALGAVSGTASNNNEHTALGGVAYWNEDMPYNLNGTSVSAIEGNLIPGQPFVMEETYLRYDIDHSWWHYSDPTHEMWPEYIGYLPPLSDNGCPEDPYQATSFNIEDLSLHGSYLSGVCSFPVLCMVPGTDEMVAVWSALDENHTDASGNYYYKIFASYSGDGGTTWSPMVHLTRNPEFDYSEFVYNQAVVVGRKLIIATQTDEETGTYVQGDEYVGDNNYYKGFVFDIDELFETNHQPVTTDGVLNGVFSVGDNSTVRFSQGNLQYIGSAGNGDENNTGAYWKFADHQWDYLGDNGQGSDSKTVDRDLFGWGTSGYNHGANCYQPWSISSTYSDYYAYGNSGYNLFDQSGQADWGYNAISNGGNQENSGWRTLTRDEWDYVFNTRTMVNGGPRFTWGRRVEGVLGVIVYPDNYTGLVVSSDLTSEGWAEYEAAGCVFLPAAGYRYYRYGTSVNDVGSIGFYWSASYSDTYYAWDVDFSDSFLGIDNDNDRSNGQSVRLVRSAQNYSYSINAAPNPAEGGAVSGAGAYAEGAECTLTATASAGYIFVNWTENGEVVSTDPTYLFTVTGDRELVANFSAAVDAVQEIHLSEGWNWFSSYITYDENSFGYMTEAIGDMVTTSVIKSQTEFTSLDVSGWSGTLDDLQNQNMYMILVGGDIDISLTGALVNPAAVPITLSSGWNWMVYLPNVTMSLEQGLANLEPVDGDMIKSQSGFSSYNSDEGGWVGTLNLLKPGEGYAYLNNSMEDKTLVYPNSSKGAVEENTEKRHFSYNCHRFMGNMTLMMTLDASEFDLGKGSHEIAAFVGDDCRGSAHLQEVNGQYIAFVTVGGEDGEEVTFRLFDVKGGEVYPEVAQEKLRYAADAVYGSLKEPFKLHFRGAGVDETEAMLRVSPNPVYALGEVRLSMPTTEKVRVEIYSALGVKVMSQETSDGRIVLSPAVVPGTYIMKVVSASGAGHYCKLIVE